MRFTKMHGIGNDYVYVDLIDDESDRTDWPAVARIVSDRHKGIGGDGLILVAPSESDVTAAGRMIMFNADGTESEMCGNGLRCVAKILHDRGYARADSLDIQTGNGVLSVGVERDASGQASNLRVNMGHPILQAARIPTTLAGDPPINAPLGVEDRTFEVTSVSMGNPHCVVFTDDLSDDLVLRYGPLIEHHDTFPNRVNVEFVRVESRTEFTQRTWERGSGETQACGTGASAVCVAGVLTGRMDRTVTGHLLGGDLILEWVEDGPVLKTGGATEVFRGEIDLTPFGL